MPTDSARAPLSPEAAKELLLLHATQHPSIDHPTWRGGFLGSLRPYTGLNPMNYVEVIACVRALAPTICESERVDRETLAAIWGICHSARAWALDPDGALRANGLITPEDRALLETWISQLSYTTMCLLEGQTIETAFEFVDEYLEQTR